MVEVAAGERMLFSEVLERESRKRIQMLKAFPPEMLDDLPGDCAQTARDLALAFVERERLMHYVLHGRSAGSEPDPSASLPVIVASYESALRETRSGVSRLTGPQWSETIRGPAGIGLWERARRGELLWLALKDLIRADAHFAVHLRVAREAVMAGDLAPALEFTDE